MNRRVALASALSATAAVGAYAIWSRWPNQGRSAHAPRLIWAFEAPRPGGVIAAPLVTSDTIFLPVVQVNGFSLSGAVYAIDSDTGKSRWVYDQDGDLLASASTPALCGDTLLFGEGMHANFACRLHAVDATTGRMRWTFPTADHIECGPLVVGDRAYITAGNDGVYAIDIGSGRPVWHYAEDFHADCTPALADGLVFIGTGPSRRFRATEIIALDANSGAPRWRTPVPLPAWSSPVVADGQVFIGLGNGRLTVPAQPPETPAGGLICLDAADGHIRWYTPFGDAVFARPLLHGRLLVVGSRDGNLYAIDRENGRERFRTPMGSSVMTDAETDGASVFAVSANGRVCAIDSTDGRERWRVELSELAKSAVQVLAPLRYADGRLYVGAEVKPGNATGIATLFCLQVPTH